MESASAMPSRYSISRYSVKLSSTRLRARSLSPCLSATHPSRRDTTAMPSLRASRDCGESNFIRAAASSIPCQRLTNQPLGKSLHALVVLRFRGDNGVKVPIAHLTEDTPLNAHFFQELLGIGDQLR